MGRIAGQPNKLTTEVKNKLQTVMDDVVSQLDISEMTTDQKLKMLQIGLQYLLPKLKHVSGEMEGAWEQPVFLDVYTKKESRPVEINNALISSIEVLSSTRK